MQGVNIYQEVAITSQSRGRIVVMLYEGAIKFLKLAINEIKLGNSETKGNYINKAVDIIAELNAVLDMETGGEVAVNLRKLYIFMNTHLSQANAEQSSEMIDDVIRILEELNRGWKEIA
ncbi:MAG: flagellar export chaperone FliS [Anaerohalosphaeraceae bacterium]|nr:flagellar export chaperone FliS [Anaerohalosphaeraceae bacterium]